MQKSPVADPLQPGGKAHRREAGAILERIVTDFFDAGGDGDAGQVVAEFKGLLRDDRPALRDLHAGDVQAVKDAIAHIGQALGQGQGAGKAAVEKRLIPDRPQPLRQGELALEPAAVKGPVDDLRGAGGHGQPVAEVVAAKGRRPHLRPDGGQGQGAVEILTGTHDAVLKAGCTAGILKGAGAHAGHACRNGDILNFIGISKGVVPDGLQLAGQVYLSDVHVVAGLEELVKRIAADVGDVIAEHQRFDGIFIWIPLRPLGGAVIEHRSAAADGEHAIGGQCPGEAGAAQALHVLRNGGQQHGIFFTGDRLLALDIFRCRRLLCFLCLSLKRGLGQHRGRRQAPQQTDGQKPCKKPLLHPYLPFLRSGRIGTET